MSPPSIIGLRKKGRKCLRVRNPKRKSSKPRHPTRPDLNLAVIWAVYEVRIILQADLFCPKEHISTEDKTESASLSLFQQQNLLNFQTISEGGPYLQPSAITVKQAHLIGKRILNAGARPSGFTVYFVARTKLLLCSVSCPHSNGLNPRLSSVFSSRPTVAGPPSSSQDPRHSPCSQAGRTLPGCFLCGNWLQATAQSCAVLGGPDNPDKSRRETPGIISPRQLLEPDGSASRRASFFLLVTVLSTALLLALHKSTVYSRPAKPSPVKPSNQKNHFSSQFGFNQHSLIKNGQRREFVPYHTTSGLLHDTSIIIVVRNTYHHQPVLPTLAAHLGLRFPHPGISLPCIRLLFRWCCHPSVPPVLSKSRF